MKAIETIYLILELKGFLLKLRFSFYLKKISIVIKKTEYQSFYISVYWLFI